MPHVAFHTFPVPEFSSPAFSSLAFSAPPMYGCKQSCHYLWWFSRYSGKCRVATFFDAPCKFVWDRFGHKAVHVSCHITAMLCTHVSKLMLWLQLRFDYDPTTTYRARLLPIRRKQKNEHVSFSSQSYRSRIVVESQLLRYRLRAKPASSSTF